MMPMAGFLRDSLVVLHPEIMPLSTSSLAGFPGGMRGGFGRPLPSVTGANVVDLVRHPLSYHPS